MTIFFSCSVHLAFPFADSLHTLVHRTTSDYKLFASHHIDDRSVDSCSFSVFALLRVENPAPSRTRGFRGFNRFPAITKHKFTTSIGFCFILYVLSRVQGLTQFDNYFMAHSTSASAFGNKVVYCPTCILVFICTVHVLLLLFLCICICVLYRCTYHSSLDFLIIFTSCKPHHKTHKQCDGITKQQC